MRQYSLTLMFAAQARQVAVSALQHIFFSGSFAHSLWVGSLAQNAAPVSPAQAETHVSVYARQHRARASHFFPSLST